MIKEKQRSDVAASFSPRQRSMPSYRLAETDLEMGASLGNSAIWLNTKSSGAIERIFSIERGKNLFGSISLRYGGTGSSLRSASETKRRSPAGVRYIGLDRDGPAEVEIHPVFQRRRFSNGGAIAVTETLFVPLGKSMDDAPMAYVWVDVEAMDLVQHDLRVICYARLGGSPGDNIQAVYDPSLHALVALDTKDPDSVRIFGLDVEPEAFATTTDFGSVCDQADVRGVTNDTSARGDVLGVLQLDLCVRPDEPVTFCVIAGAYSHGERAARAAYGKSRDWGAVFAETTSYMEELLDTARIVTPDQSINRGAVWSKVNMRRVMAAYPQGHAFTNEPGVSSNVVMRDVAWFVYGCDHFMPEFSRGLLDKFASLQYPNGKVAEYFNALDGTINDYGLNINDDTPLFILATSGIL